MQPNLPSLDIGESLDLYIQPSWLTMVYGSGICQICTNPEGDTRTYYLNLKYNCEDKSGYYVCGKLECQTFIKTYLKKIYWEIYNTKQWQSLLCKYANNEFITVERSNGAIENDWTLDNYNENNQYPLNQSILYAILCSNKQFENKKGSKLPKDIWEYIYKLCLKTYTDNINLTLSYTNEHKMSYNILVVKGEGKEELRKSIPLELI